MAPRSRILVLGMAAAAAVAALTALVVTRLQEKPTPAAPAPPPPAPPVAQLEVSPPAPQPDVPAPQLAWRSDSAPSGTPLAASPDGAHLWLLDLVGGEAVLRRWEVASGQSQVLRIVPASPADAAAKVGDWPVSYSAIVTAAGILSVGGGTDASGILFVDGQGRARLASLQRPRTNVRLVPLADGSVLAIGGVVGMQGERRIFTNAVERIAVAEGRPASSLLPDVPGEVRRGLAAAELADGRVIVVGGSTAPYTGSEPMTADTWLLDLAQGKWSPGPRLLQPRSNATATRLPDGSLLVAGGWTPGDNWNTAASRTTERLRPGATAFVADAPLPQGLAGHRALWLPGQTRTQLVLAGGWARAWSGNQSVQVLDAARGEWRLAASGCTADRETGELFFVPAIDARGAAAWCEDGRGAWSRVALHPAEGGTAVPAAAGESGVLLGRARVAFLPAVGESPALALGGSANGVPTAAVDALWRDGRVSALPAMRRARDQAQALRLADGSILVAGFPTPDPRHAPPGLEAEVLPGGTQRAGAAWTDVALDLPADTLLARHPDGSLVALHPDGTLESLALSGTGKGKVQVRRSPLPPMTRYWRLGDDRAPGAVAMRVLQDGSIVVAGGLVQRDRIAVFHEAVEDPAAPDRFAGWGEFQGALTHEIFDPAARLWRESAPSLAGEGRVAILDDGSVVKVGPLPAPTANGASADYTRAALQISTPDGSAWRTFEGPEAPLITVDRMTQEARPFVIEGELFLAGRNLNDVTPQYARGPLMLQRWNRGTRRWVTLWEAPENTWQDHLGRMIVREIAPGRRVVLPIGGP
jgi:hypothetical protein